jgi:cytosolic carboxypeptidase protein 6
MRFFTTTLVRQGVSGCCLFCHALCQIALWVLLIAGLGQSAAAQTRPVAVRAPVLPLQPATEIFTLLKNRHPFHVAYQSNHPLDRRNKAVDQLVVYIHGAGRNSVDYYRWGLDAVQRAGKHDQTLYIAPQYLQERDLDTLRRNGPFLFWSNNGWKVGDHSLSTPGHPRLDSLSSFEWLDSLIAQVHRSRRFPNLKRVVVIGHSAGGQFAQRYAALSPLPDALPGLQWQFIIMNPSSYVYFDKRRPESPLIDVSAGDCPSYNTYPKGLERPNLYAQSNITRAQECFLNRQVALLLGGADNNPRDFSLDTSCSARIQGRYRLERGLFFSDYVRSLPKGKGQWKVAVVPGVGHSGQMMALSDAAHALLFPEKYPFPNPVDTRTRPIVFQQKQLFVTSAGVCADNRFDAARLNDFIALDDSTFRAFVAPENTPINPSPWYAFKIAANQQRNITLQLQYSEGKHRYAPKYSYDGALWFALDTQQVQTTAYGADMHLRVGPDTLWIAAQELMSSAMLRNWQDTVAPKGPVQLSVIGKSALGRDLWCMDIGTGKPDKKPLVVLLSRQHPPEVTGQMALQRFVERLLGKDALAQNFLERYRVLVFPMLNPDGVDLGHWRHNVGGIDLNRDWDVHHQSETWQVARHIRQTAEEHRNRVVLGLDFHSTMSDVYYTNLTDSLTAMPNFSRNWIAGIQKEIPGYQPRVEPSGMNQPISKGWFFQQFQAPSVTYEIGDNTPRSFIAKKAAVSAEVMMRELLRY